MARNNHVFVQGDITGNIRFDVLRLNEKDIQFLRMFMFVKAVKGTKTVQGLPIVVYGPQAELAYGHVQKGSRIAVMGHFQQRTTQSGLVLTEVVAEEVQYLRNIDWTRGETTRKELVTRGELRPSYQDITQAEARV